MGNIVTLRFYEELNDYLPAAVRRRAFEHCVRAAARVGDTITACGVPAEAVDLVLVNGESAGFGHRLHHGDRVSIYPVFETLDIAAMTRLPGRPLRRPRFVITGALSNLARTLAAGSYPTVLADPADECLDLVVRGWILVSDDIRTLARLRPPRALGIRGGKPVDQVREISERLQLPISFGHPHSSARGRWHGDPDDPASRR